MNSASSLFLQDLSCELQYKVKHKFNIGNAWKLIADYCNLGDEYGLNVASNRGEALFYELCAQNYTVAELCQALAKCELIQILALFQEPAPLEIEPQPSILCEEKSFRTGSGNEIFIDDGEELKLKAEAKGIPPPKFEWYCDNTLLSASLSGLLTIEKFGKKNEGRYWCKISQEQENSEISEITEDITVAISKHLAKEKIKISAKKALLIANQSYDHDVLLAPASDTAKLCDVLKQDYNFDVTVKTDLTGEGMKDAVKEFWEAVDDHSYVIFYFAGHGFRRGNDVFFMGVDKIEPKDFGFEHAMSHEEVIQEGSGHKPSLLLMLCDTCQSQLQDDKYATIKTQSPPRYNYSSYPDVIEGYATSRNGEAIEVATSGLFTKHLIKVLKNNCRDADKQLSVSEILAKVRTGVNKEASKYADVELQVPVEVTSATRSHYLRNNPISKRKK